MFTLRSIVPLSQRMCRLLALVMGMGSASAAWADTTPAPAASRPNIVVIVADDLGYGELGCFGGTQTPTPHLDALAKSGVRCTSGYVSCPVCSPTRAGLLTGRYQQRFGHEFNPGPPGQAAPNFGLPEDQVTLAQRLHEAGYVTGMVGKWHLGYRLPCTPLRRGFDEFYGFLGGAHDYQSGGARRREDRDNPIYRQDQPIKETEYLTDALAREACQFVTRHRDQPFFLYLTFNAVHAPLQAAANYRERVSAIDDPRRQTFAAMLVAMDDAVGRLRQQLADAGLTERTLVFFISDNGGPTPQTTSSNSPLSGYKGGVREGGVRVPFIVSWPQRLPAGATFALPVSSLDIFPTALAAAGQAAPAEPVLDGVDLLPHLEGRNADPPHAQLFWRSGEKRALRAGRWKLILEESGPELYDLDADLGEQHNLAAKYPDQVAQLTAQWDAWNATLQPARWRRR